MNLTLGPTGWADEGDCVACFKPGSSIIKSKAENFPSARVRFCDTCLDELHALLVMRKQNLRKKR